MSEFAIATAFGGDIDDYRSRLEGVGHLGRDQDGSLLTRNRGSSDHHILFSQNLG